jgi:ketosteroid isomerase-like protein
MGEAVAPLANARLSQTEDSPIKTKHQPFAASIRHSILLAYRNIERLLADPARREKTSKGGLVTKDTKDKAALIVGGRSGIGRAAVLAATLPALYAWTVRFMLRRNLGRLRAGDVGPLFGTYAEDIRFVLPGRHSWAGDYRGEDEVERWMRRFVRVGLQLELQEILVTGPAWNTTVCLRFTDQRTAPDGDVVYANRGMIFGKISWGRVTYYEVHEDTQKVAELDEYLASHEPTGP